ncbi:MAG: alanine racemase, partial [Colwellia sp.]|nr:alanine racemase [Colwellia sp.]
MNRRQFILAGVAVGVAGALSLKPSDNGAPYNEYFNVLNNSLKEGGDFIPSMLVDLDLLDNNIAVLKAQLNPAVDYRIVAKSLPSPSLLGYIMEKANTNKLMVFHQPFLNHIAREYPNVDVLMGKPMPVKAAEIFYQSHDNPDSFKAELQLQWLIDSEARLSQYLALAKALQVRMQVNIEIDVGLHRGGLQEAAELDSLLKLIQENPQYLSFSGFMGYDPHVVKIPSI